MSWYYKSRVILFWLAVTYLFMTFLWKDNIETNVPIPVKVEMSDNEIKINGEYFQEGGTQRGRWP